MKRVAARAKVSVTTVSRVVNQSGYVASGVREKVLKAMKELKYQPSASIARTAEEAVNHPDVAAVLVVTSLCDPRDGQRQAGR